MGQSYRHLTAEDRIVIRTLLQEGRSRRYIADRIGFDLSSVKREIRRNSGLRGYHPRQAQLKAEARKRRARTRKMTPEVVSHIEGRLRREHSPEQISWTMQARVGVRVSHERIYRHVWADKRAGGSLYTHLRIANGRRQRKRYGRKSRRGRIPGRVDIEQRPAVVERKERLGDWEADLVAGARRRGFLVTVVERVSKYTLIGHVAAKTAKAVGAELVRLLGGVKDLVHTITYDNGREFYGHQAVSAALGCAGYFAKPYHAWERGLCENTNGLLRQYFPKGSDLCRVTPASLRFVEDRLNGRPRKTLGFRTPETVFHRRT